jgi:hypothetical protein
MFIQEIFPYKEYDPRGNLVGIDATIELRGLTKEQYLRLSGLIGCDIAIIDLTDHRDQDDLNKKRAMFEAY